MVIRNWVQIGNPTPVYKDNKANKSFESILPYPPEIPFNKVNGKAHLNENRIPESNEEQQEYELTPSMIEILEFCNEYKSLNEIMKNNNRSDKTKFRRMKITPLLEKGFLEKKYLYSRDPNQKNITTPKGIFVLNKKKDQAPSRVSSGY